MLPIISSLLQVQDRDQRLLSLQRDLKAVPALKERAKSQLADDQAATDSAQGKMREVEIKMKNLDLDIQTRQNTIQRLKDQQFQTRKNDEFQAMGQEIVRYQGDVSKLEDKQIEHMEELEAAKAVLTDAQGKLGITQGHVNEELAALDERAKNLEARIAELKADRAKVSEGLEPSALSLYDRLFKNKAGSAIVAADSGVCRGCNMKLITATMAALKADDSIVHCEQCGRILYYA
jgi:uncharacterized protein